MTILAILVAALLGASNFVLHSHAAGAGGPSMIPRTGPVTGGPSIQEVSSGGPTS